MDKTQSRDPVYWTSRKAEIPTTGQVAKLKSQCLDKNSFATAETRSTITASNRLQRGSNMTNAKKKEEAYRLQTINKLL